MDTTTIAPTFSFDEEQRRLAAWITRGPAKKDFDNKPKVELERFATVFFNPASVRVLMENERAAIVESLKARAGEISTVTLIEQSAVFRHERRERWLVEVKKDLERIIAQLNTWATDELLKDISYRLEHSDREWALAARRTVLMTVIKIADNAMKRGLDVAAAGDAALTELQRLFIRDVAARSNGMGGSTSFQSNLMQHVTWTETARMITEMKEHHSLVVVEEAR